jgi:hypothetical protein
VLHILDISLSCHFHLVSSHKYTFSCRARNVRQGIDFNGNCKNLLFGVTAVGLFAVVFISYWQLIRQPETPPKTNNSSDKLIFKCSCNRTLKQVTNNNSDNNSTVHQPGGFPWCSANSSTRGAHQKVITYSLFATENYENLPVSKRYDTLLRKILIAVEKLYSGWIVRIYHIFHSENDSKRNFFPKSCAN